MPATYHYDNATATKHVELSDTVMRPVYEVSDTDGVIGYVAQYDERWAPYADRSAVLLDKPLGPDHSHQFAVTQLVHNAQQHRAAA